MNKRVEKAITGCVNVLTDSKLSREELVVVLGQLLIRSGYSIYWGYEEPMAERPEQVSKEMADELYMGNPTTGTTLLKVGFDLQDVLVLKTERRK